MRQSGLASLFLVPVMNTPSSKAIVRVARRRNIPERRPPKDGWTAGIQSPEHAQLVGQVVTYLPHLEEMMIAVLSRLLGHPPIDNGPARQVFRAVESERARIALMKALLQDAFINVDKPKLFDDVIDLFQSVKDKRNTFAHALWFTHESGDVTFQSRPPTAIRHNRA